MRGVIAGARRRRVAQALARLVLAGLLAVTTSAAAAPGGPAPVRAAQPSTAQGGVGTAPSGAVQVWVTSVTNPIPPALSSGVAEVAVGGVHFLARKEDGSVHAVGTRYYVRDLYGEKVVPEQAQGATAIAAGWGHSLAVVGGGVVAWGNDWFGQTDVPEAARSGVVDVSSLAFHSLALKSDGGVVSWGLRDDVPPEASSGVTAIAAGGDFNLALKDGGVVAWGINTVGQTDVPPEARSGVVSISAGWSTALALKADGSVVAWGSNKFGRATPPATTASGIVAVSAGWQHNVALTSTGRVIGWGYNRETVLSYPAATWGSGVQGVVAGDRYTVAIR
ncbi:RCC1 domain-containing protein [Prauserella flavalba]|uniref:RCC1 domain-containing protein n=1 Tax=Prauserella flavalba TaxID=1477506 RepID=UPI0036ED875E